MYGADAAAAGDLDGDGDLDVVAAGFLPQIELPVAPGNPRIDSVIWFERDGNEWIAWAIESNHPLHASLRLMDVNSDGRLDIVSGILAQSIRASTAAGPSLEVWINHGTRQAPSARTGTDGPSPDS